jgi:hypothetical protein
LRTLLQIQLTDKREAYETLRAEVSRALLFPTIYASEDSVATLNLAVFDSIWANDSAQTARQVRALRHFEDGNYSFALAELPVGNDDDWLKDMHALLSIGASLNGDWASADSLQRQMLWGFWLDEESPAGVSALSILHLLGETDEMPEARIPMQYRSAFIAAKQETSESSLMSVFPTNAVSEIMVGYPAEADGMSELLVFDAQGRLISRLKLNHNGFLSLNISHYAQGSYHVVLFSNGMNMASGRFNKFK